MALTVLYLYLAYHVCVSVCVCIRRWRFTCSHLAFGLSFFSFFCRSIFSLTLAGSLAPFPRCIIPLHLFLYRIHQGIQTNMLQFVWHDTLNDFDGKSIFLCYSTRAFNLNLCGFKRLSDRRRYWPMTMDVCAIACMSNRGRKKSITFQLSAWGLTVKSN